MRQEFVKTPLPCSFFDIQGIQNWLDEMALQGLFLDRLSYHNDRGYFKRGEPRPIRYRLDPIWKNQKDLERKELYAQAGWAFVDTVPQMFYIFSCDDPQAPELHSDPAALSYALKTLVRRQLLIHLVLFLVSAALTTVIILSNWSKCLSDLLLMEHPLVPWVLLILLGCTVYFLVIGILKVRRLNRTRDLLEQGLVPKAGRRHWRPNVPYLALCLPIILLLNLSLNKALYYSTVDYLSLSALEPSHLWPTIAQLEAAGPRPLAEEPSGDGYATVNHSWFAPVQEFIETTYHIPSFGNYWTGVRYIQARSPWAAERIFQTELDAAANYLDNWLYWNGTFHIADLQPFQPYRWPGLDRLEVAQYTRWERDCWSLAVQRGTDILVVEYVGYAPWESCLPLFLEALEHPLKGDDLGL